MASTTWAGTVGRDTALAAVVRTLSGGERGERGSILVLGARGLGRTSVVNAALAQLDLDPVRLVAVPCQATGAYASLLHALSGLGEHPSFAPLAAAWLAILEHAGDDPGHTVASRLLAARREQPGTTPLVLVVDDAHYLDRNSQLVVSYLAHHGAALGLPAVLTADEECDLSAFVGLPRLRLTPLTADQLRLLLERSAETPLVHRVAALLHHWSGGNPTLALDLHGQLDEAEVSGNSPISLPLTPTADLVQRLGDSVAQLADDEQRLLALLALQDTLPLELACAAASCSEAVVDRLVAAGRLGVQHRRVEPTRRLESLLAWAALAPSLQHQLTFRLAEELGRTDATAASYLAALAGDEEATAGLVDVVAGLQHSGRYELAAAAGALALARADLAPLGGSVLLAQLLMADGYLGAARQQLHRVQRQAGLGRSALLRLTAELATMTSDPTEALPHVDAGHPPDSGLDEWLAAVLALCRLELALDGPSESTRLGAQLEPVLTRASPATRVFAAVVTAERDVYQEVLGSPERLSQALEEWLGLRSGDPDQALMAAVLDLLGLGRVEAARQLLAAAGSPAEIPYASVRTGLLILRTATELAAGRYRRAAASLLAADRERPCPSGTDLMMAGHALRVGAVCDDVEECRSIEERVSRSSMVLSYPSRRSYTAAQGFRALVEGRYRESRELLTLALQGPALLVQGRACVLADLVEATVADGAREVAAELFERHVGWLPDRAGDRAEGLLARCEALVAPAAEVDDRFDRALRALAPSQDMDRARTLLAHSRALLGHGRVADAAAPLAAASELFREQGVTGWERHLQRLHPPADHPGTDHRGADHVTAGDRDAAHRHGDRRPAPGAPGPGPGGHGLSEIEQRVLALVLQRKRNREIAATLFVSLRTVEAHLTHIFRKYGVTSKAQLHRRLMEGAREPEEAAELTRISAQ